MSVQAKLEVVRRKHIVHLTGFGAYSYLVILDGPHVPAPWEQLLLPPSRFRSEAHMKLVIYITNIA